MERRFRSWERRQTTYLDPRALTKARRPGAGNTLRPDDSRRRPRYARRGPTRGREGTPRRRPLRWCDLPLWLRGRSRPQGADLSGPQLAGFSQHWERVPSVSELSDTRTGRSVASLGTGGSNQAEPFCAVERGGRLEGGVAIQCDWYSSTGRRRSDD